MQKRLTPDQVTEVIRLFTTGSTYKELAEQFNVDGRAIWYHLKKHKLLGTRQLGRPNEYTEDALTFKCGTCKLVLPREAFGVRTNLTRGGLRPVRWRCRSCEIVVTAMSRYQISYADASKFLRQEQCDICTRPQNMQHQNGFRRSMFIDHDHTTGRIRGALCEACNSGLGLVRDSPAKLALLRCYILRPIPELPSAEPHKSCSWTRHIERTYGLSGSQYAWLLKQQVGHCAGCAELITPTAKFPRLLVDHCHAQGHVRGLLCYSCNLAVGKFDNNPELFTRAITYLTCDRAN